MRYLAIILLVLLYGCEKEEYTIERLVNAVWSSDDTQVLKVFSLYDTPKPNEIHYYAPSGKNWRYRFELCDSNLLNSVVVGSSPDIMQGGTLEYVFLYWLSSVNKMVTMNPAKQAVLKDLNGHETPLLPPSDFVQKVYVKTNGVYDAFGVAPSPNEEVVAVYHQAAYFISPYSYDLNYHQSLSFFDSKTGSHLYSQEIPEREIFFALTDTLQNDNRIRSYFLWAKDGSGVYLISRNLAYFVAFGAERGIVEVDLVPEHLVITNSGNISNGGKKLQMIFGGNSSSLHIITIDRWVPFFEVELINKEENDYSLW